MASEREPNGPIGAEDTSRLDKPLAGDDAALDEITEADLRAARERRVRRAAEASSDKSSSSLRNTIEWVVVLIAAVAVALVVRTFIFQTFWIPSPSMAETLVEDDRVLVNKLSYRFGEPGRGDVVVFKRPPGVPGTIDDLIKRVVAVEGERISIREGKVWVDDRPLTEPYVGDQETFANVGCGSGDTTGIDTIEGFVVPDDHIFVLGDNRGDSSDGRCFGPVHTDLLVGRAFLVLWPPSKIGGL